MVLADGSRRGEERRSNGSARAIRKRGGEVGQTHSQPRSVGVEVAEGSGPVEGKNVNAERVYSAPSTTSIPPDSM
jgi:hypothetical protein